jgi:hypothetical protein
VAPEDLPRRAREAGVSVLALTDHDTLEGLVRFREACAQWAVVPVAGIELSLRLDGKRLHLLGLGLDLGRTQALDALLRQVKIWRNDRNMAMIERFNRLKIQLTLEEVEREARGDIVARPHFARALIRRGVVVTMEEAFHRFLGDAGPAYVRKVQAPVPDAISAIKAAGGLAVAAHPYTLLDESCLGMERRLESLLEMGADGAEAWHTQQPRAVTRRVVALMKTRGGLLSAGSDFHGENRDDSRLGHGHGGQLLRSSLVPDILQRLGVSKPDHQRVCNG